MKWKDRRVVVQFIYDMCAPTGGTPVRDEGPFYLGHDEFSVATRFPGIAGPLQTLEEELPKSKRLVHALFKRDREPYNVGLWYGYLLPGEIDELIIFLEMIPNHETLSTLSGWLRNLRKEHPHLSIVSQDELLR